MGFVGELSTDELFASLCQRFVQRKPLCKLVPLLCVYVNEQLFGQMKTGLFFFLGPTSFLL